MTFLAQALAVLAAALLAAGCGDDDQAPEAPESGPLVTYARSGGVAGVPERLVVERDGAATVEVGIEGARQSFELPVDELEQLRSELEAADFESVDDPPSPPTCADCFVYEIVYDGTTISYDDANPPPESVSSVVASLAAITGDHYPPGAFEPGAG
jgi:hypothetical protein